MQIPAIYKSTINRRSRVCSRTHVFLSSIDRYTYIGNNCTVINTKIGSFCSIADDCSIGLAEHPLNWISTSPVFAKGRNILRVNFSNHTIDEPKLTIIENDVWIGTKVMIKSGITIHTGAVVGMGSVVTRDIGPYEIWAGNPAKLIRKRFTDETINSLLRIHWWDWDKHTLSIYSSTFNNISNFLLLHGKQDLS